MGDIAFFTILVTLLVLSVIFRGHPKTPDEVSTIVPAYEYADPLYESSFGFNPTPSTPVPEDNDKFPDEQKEIASEYDDYNATKEHMLLDPTGPLPTEMGNLHQDYDGFNFITGEAELNATPTMEVDIHRNDTSLTLEENIPLETAFTLIEFAIVMLTMVNFALFITTILFMWNLDFTLPYIKYEVTFEIKPRKPNFG